ncbi:MAG: hypothetical protein AB7S99_22630 [Pseudodonghicola sp.]
MSEEGDALALMATTFAIGAVAGLTVFAGASWLNPEAATLAFDWFGNGLDLFDAIIPAWFLGHAALIAHHILPGIARA